VDTTSISLLDQVRSGADERAWERFVTLYTPFLFSCAQRAGLDHHDSCELVQDVLLHLLSELPKFRYDDALHSFRGWLRTVTINKCRERFRKRVPSGLDQTIDLAAIEEEAFWEVEHRDFLARRAMQIMQDEFETRTWRACCEFIMSGRKAADIAAELGMSEAAVFMAKSRVLNRLRRELSGLVE